MIECYALIPVTDNKPLKSVECNEIYICFNSSNFVKLTCITGNNSARSLWNADVLRKTTDKSISTRNRLSARDEAVVSPSVFKGIASFTGSNFTELHRHLVALCIAYRDGGYGIYLWIYYIKTVQN